MTAIDRPSFGTIACTQDLPHALELMRSVRRHHGGASCTIWVVGGVPDHLAERVEVPAGVEVRPAGELAPSDEIARERFHAGFDDREIGALLIPAAMRALAGAEAETAIVLAPRSLMLEPLAAAAWMPGERELVAYGAVAFALPAGSDAFDDWIVAGEQAALLLDPMTLFEADHACQAFPGPRTTRPTAALLDLGRFDPAAPWFVGEAGDETSCLSDHPDLAATCASYAESIIADAVRLETSTDPYPILRIPKIERRAVRRRERGMGVPLDLETWLREPVGALGRVNRYLHELWLGRADVQLLYPSIETNDESASAFLQWVLDHGAREHEVPTTFLPTELQLQPRWSGARPTRRGVRLVGHLHGNLGVGEVARRAADALERAGIDWAAWVDRGIPAVQSQEFAERHASSDELDTNLICINADELPRFAGEVGERYFGDRYTIGVWFWEVTVPPQQLPAALAYIDELWVASEFIADVLAPHIGDVPIRVMPLAVRAPEPSGATRAELGLPPSAFLYGFMFDFNSTLERKNTLGLVESYRRAYPDPSAETALIIKSMHGEQNLRELEQLRFAIMDRPDIQLIDEHLSIGDRDAMLHAFDCYVSLHRSEGFGLTIAEALLAGVPTIATGYSANVEFAGADVCYLVDYEMCEVPEGLGPYPAGGLWADPDIDHAARLMRHVRDHTEEVRAKAAEGAGRIAEQCSLDAAAAFMRTRLDEIWKEHPLPDPNPAPLPDPIGDVERFVADGPEGGWLAGTGGVRHIARRTLLRLMQPYTARRAQLDADIARSLRHLQQQIDDRDV